MWITAAAVFAFVIVAAAVGPAWSGRLFSGRKRDFVRRSPAAPKRISIRM
jgi:hypothetical protein